MTASASAKKDVQRLQRAIVDGLEDVKGQDIVVFDTESLSPLFERVIIASGTSNRQTRALAASVRDAVREAGFDKPRIEGEENGEWIIVDCGAAVAHVMQPVIRQYYRLEEIWGGKAVRLKHGAPKPVVAESTASSSPKRAAAKAPVKTAKPATSRVATKTVDQVATKAPAKSPAKKVTHAVAPAAAKVAAKAPAKTAAKTTVKTATKVATKTVVVNKPKAVAKTAAKADVKPASKPVAKRAPGRSKKA